MDITKQALHSLDSYFNTLSQFGYKKQSDLDKLIILLFIEELLTEERVLITEEDYRDIDNALNCLYGSSCLIPYPLYINDDSLFGVIDNGLYISGVTECSCKKQHKHSNYNH